MQVIERMMHLADALASHNEAVNLKELAREERTASSHNMHDRGFGAREVVLRQLANGLEEGTATGIVEVLGGQGPGLRSRPARTSARKVAPGRSPAWKLKLGEKAGRD